MSARSGNCGVGIVAVFLWATQPGFAQPNSLSPPHVVDSTPPLWTHDSTPPTVHVLLTLSATGEATAAHVEDAANEEIARAALKALKAWRFEPARRGNDAISSRLRVAVTFELATFDVSSDDAAAASTAHETDAAVAHAASSGAAYNDESSPNERQDGASGHEAQADEGQEDEADDHRAPHEEHPEMGVDAEVEAPEPRESQRGASSFEVDHETLNAAPHEEGADLLRVVPGVFAARAEGLAVGHRINLRGFDAEHGQDIELRVGGLPVNLPSHIHGQGYADLGFLISETVQRVRVIEGVSDPRQGDFAVAGSISFDLGVPEDKRGWQLASSYGRFNTFRQLVMWAPENQSTDTLAAVQLRRTDGFGDNRGGESVSALVQVGGGGSEHWKWRAIGLVHGSRADLAGVVRADDVGEGRIGHYEAYPDSTAQNQNALNGRFMAGLFADHRSSNGANGGFGIWLGADTFRVQENFTGFVQRSRTLDSVAGRGDLIEQRNRALSAGLQGRFRTSRWEPARWLGAHLELGLNGRVDFIDQEQNLLGNRNQTWDQQVSADVFGANLGLWLDVEMHFTSRVRVHAGVRAALLAYEVDDRLGNFVPMVRPRDDFIVGFRRSAAGTTVGPRASAEYIATDWLSIVASYGEGYRSPQARTLDDGERAPFTKVRSADVGLVFAKTDVFRLGLSGYWTRLSDDVAFEPRDGRLDRIGESRRFGAAAYLEATPLKWLRGAVSTTYVNAELLEPPPATADDPQPAFEAGQNLPYVPPVVVRADLGASGQLAHVVDKPLRGRVGIGYSFLSPRPLAFGGFAKPVHLLDASAGIQWGPVELSASVFNLVNQRWAAAEFIYVSNWDSAGIPSRLPARHIAAGSPLTWMVTLRVRP